MMKRRFELHSSQSSRFWEIWIDAAKVFTRQGALGTDGGTTVREEGSPAAAKRLYANLVRERTTQGYFEQLAPPPPAPKPKKKVPVAAGPTNPDLEAAIERSPDDARGYLVYADWLSARTDPRGELIVLMEEGSAASQAAAAALIKDNRGHLLGPLETFDREGERRLELTWQLGFIHTATMAWPLFEPDTDDAERAAGELGALLDLPSARFLRGLHVGPLPAEDVMSFQCLIDVLQKKGGPPTLEELYLGHLGSRDISSTATGEFGPLAKTFKNLRRVTLRAGLIGFGRNVALPQLKELTIETGSLRISDLEELATMTCPKLERLSLWFGSHDYGASGQLEDIQWLLSAAGFPKLRHLGIMNCEFVNDVAEALPGSKVLSQLTSLDLSMGCLNDRSIEAMVASKAFGHVDSLNLDDNALTEASRPRVSGLAKAVNFGSLQDPSRSVEEGHHRYCAVGE